MVRCWSTSSRSSTKWVTPSRAQIGAFSGPPSHEPEVRLGDPDRVEDSMTTEPVLGQCGDLGPCLGNDVDATLERRNESCKRVEDSIDGRCVHRPITEEARVAVLGDPVDDDAANVDAQNGRPDGFGCGSLFAHSLLSDDRGAPSFACEMPVKRGGSSPKNALSRSDGWRVHGRTNQRTLRSNAAKARAEVDRSHCRRYHRGENLRRCCSTKLTVSMPSAEARTWR